eukprot:TRINITY_DN9698_c0_g2_i1.p1 TRINITY_DN9698_c0_g2~~TRINITY_DN9698_c0_g2_i1.p1  ORF type:complete len:402 (-),score=61.46 TRINITY_DN9698_c0_g2_i1:801-2006(-)
MGKKKAKITDTCLTMKEIQCKTHIEEQESLSVSCAYRCGFDCGKDSTHKKALYYCGHDTCKTRLLCQRCILRHDATHGEKIVLIEDLLGDPTTGKEPQLMTRTAEELQRISEEEATTNGLYEQLTKKTDMLIEVFMEKVKAALEHEREKICLHFWADFENHDLLARSGLIDARNEFEQLLDRLNIAREEEAARLEDQSELLGRIFALHQRHVGSRVSDIDLTLRERWNFAPVDRDEITREIETLSEKFSLVLSSLLYSFVGHERTNSSFLTDSRVHTEEVQPSNELDESFLPTEPRKVMHSARLAEMGGAHEAMNLSPLDVTPTNFVNAQPHFFPSRQPRRRQSTTNPAYPLPWSQNQQLVTAAFGIDQGGYFYDPNARLYPAQGQIKPVISRVGLPRVQS